MAYIYSIVYQPINRQYVVHNGDYIREPLEEAQLIAGHGIQGDQKGGHHPDRQLNLLSYEWLQALKPLGYRTEPGQFGEQIILSGVPFAELKPGDRLNFGHEAQVEIIKTRTGCERLQSAQPLPTGQLNPIGFLANVITGGKIRRGDPVRIVRQPVPEK